MRHRDYGGRHARFLALATVACRRRAPYQPAIATSPAHLQIVCAHRLASKAMPSHAAAATLVKRLAAHFKMSRGLRCRVAMLSIVIMFADVYHRDASSSSLCLLITCRGKRAVYYFVSSRLHYRHKRIGAVASTTKPPADWRQLCVGRRRR